MPRIDMTGRKITLKLHMRQMMALGLVVLVMVGYFNANLVSFMDSPTRSNSSRGDCSRLASERSMGTNSISIGRASATACTD